MCRTASACNIAVAHRIGNERVWDLAERIHPTDRTELSESEIAAQVLRRQLRARGVAQLASFGWLPGRTRPAGWEHALARLDTKGIVRRANIDGLTGDWFVHADALDEPFTPRTTLLSPFDPLIHDRPRTEVLFDFHYRLEMYVPRAKRQYGYFVLPILDGDQIAGRLDCRIDRNAARLDVPGIWAQPDPPDGAPLRVAAALRQLATWLGAQSIAIDHVHCSDWADTFAPHATLPPR